MTFSLPGAASLKAKRSVVRRIVDRTRAKFNASVAEVDAMDVHQRAVIGVAVVSNDARHANSMLDHISGFMAGLTEAVVQQRSLEILHVDPQEVSTGVPPLAEGLPWYQTEDDDDET